VRGCSQPRWRADCARVEGAVRHLVRDPLAPTLGGGDDSALGGLCVPGLLRFAWRPRAPAGRRRRADGAPAMADAARSGSDIAEPIQERQFFLHFFRLGLFLPLGRICNLLFD
jgi:hypothetical protein